MVETEGLDRKLRYIPNIELAVLARKIYSNKDEELKELIKNLKDRRVRDPVKFLYNSASSDDLVNIIIRGEITENTLKEIETLYDEYLYGQNPTLFFSQVLKPNWKEPELIVKELPDRIAEISAEFDEEGDPKYAGFQVEDISFPRGLIETRLFYKSRIDYIDWVTGTPEKVYSKEDGVIWISKDTNSMITKVSNATVNKHIKELMKDYFECEIKSFSINKDIADKILGSESLRSGNYKNISNNPEEADVKILKDSHLMQKREGRETNARYDRRSSYHRVDVNDLDIGLNVNSTVGKISIRAHMKKSDLRAWALELTNKIIEHLNELKESDIEKYAQGIKLSNYTSLGDIRYKKGKEIMRTLAVGNIKTFKTEGKSSFVSDVSVRDINSSLKDYFTLLFVPFCENCGSSHFECTGTGNIAEVGIKDSRNLELNCSCCNNSIDEVSHLKCAECGNSLDGELDNYMMGLLNGSGREIINSLIKELNVDREYMIEKGEQIKFQRDSFEFIKSNYKYLYLFDELPSFRHIPSFSDIDETIREAQIKNLQDSLPERCSNYSGENCRNCLSVQQGHCIQRVIGSFTNGDLHAHSPVEWGDVSFDQDIGGGYTTIPCICKSDNSSYKGKYTLKKDGRLVVQVLDAVFDTRMNFLGVVSGAHLDPKLKDTIEALAIWKGKKLVFFDKKDMIRILSQYEWTPQPAS